MTITLEQIHREIVVIKKELIHIRSVVDEELIPSDDVLKEIDESRRKSKLISHEEIRREFG